MARAAPSGGLSTKTFKRRAFAVIRRLSMTRHRVTNAARISTGSGGMSDAAQRRARSLAVGGLARRCSRRRATSTASSASRGARTTTASCSWARRSSATTRSAASDTYPTDCSATRMSTGRHRCRSRAKKQRPKPSRLFACGAMARPVSRSWCPSYAIALPRKRSPVACASTFSCAFCAANSWWRRSTSAADGSRSRLTRSTTLSVKCVGNCQMDSGG